MIRTIQLKAVEKFQGKCDACACSGVVSYEATIDGVKGTSMPVCMKCMLEKAITIIVRDPEYGPHDRKTLLKISKNQEKDIAKSIGGITHGGSGNQKHYKGDVRLQGKTRIEAKFTMKQSYRVDLKDLHKIRSECTLGETPAFEVCFVDKMTKKPLEKWVMIPREVWEARYAESEEAELHRTEYEQCHHDSSLHIQRPK